MEFPRCRQCSQGLLVPLSDFGPSGASLAYKVWVCIQPQCGFTIRIDKGVVMYGYHIHEKRCLFGQSAPRLSPKRNSQHGRTTIRRVVVRRTSGA